MSSTNAPYATLHDLPKWEKRADVGQAPWCQDQTAFKSSRGHDPLPYVACNSRTAPFATFHNIPNQGGAISEYCSAVYRYSNPPLYSKCVPPTGLYHPMSSDTALLMVLVMLLTIVQRS
uniref:Uncharacterized protein n=1 Tax=Physcomitrium patens TaxID=3218 RepID=A0A7I4CTF3_PHYPA